MKNIISLGALAGVALMALVGAGCGEEPTSTNINTHFEPKKGDTFTYARYDRDMNQQRVNESKTTHKWIVLDANISHQGMTSVARILQLNLDANGTATIAPNDTLYIRSGTDGKVYMDVIGAAVRRIEAAADLAAQIPFIWMQVTDTKTSNSLKFEGAFKIADVSLSGIPLRITFRDTAYHKGKVATTINGVAYPGAFHTDHTLRMHATTQLQAAPVIDNDSLHMSFDFDVANGLLRQSMLSDTITVMMPIVGTRQEMVAGFDFELVSVARAK